MNKKVLIVIIITIVLLTFAGSYFLIEKHHQNNSDLNNQNKTTTKEILTSKKSDENLTSCDINEDIKCIYYNNNGFSVVKAPNNKETKSYFINEKYVGNFVSLEIKEIIDNKYIIVDVGVVSEKDEMFDYYGNKIEFECDIDVCSGNALMNYTNNKLTIKYEYSLDNVEDTICTYKPLDTIVYLKQEVEYSNKKFDTPKTIETKTLKEIVKEHYNKDC